MSLANLALYDPNSLSDEEFRQTFVARIKLLEHFKTLINLESTGDCVRQHHIIIGHRGMGKSSLLRRIRLAISDDDELGKNFLPLAFREEQYNVGSLSQFLKNALDALADYYDRAGDDESVRRIEEKLRNISSQTAEDAVKTFSSEISKTDKRLLLLIDNIELVIAGLSDDECWMLRKVLSARNGPLVFGANSRSIPSLLDVKRPFFDFFRIHTLKPLNLKEVLSCLRRIGEARGENGARVLDLCNSAPERIAAIHHFTGGNPRTVSLLYQLLEESDVGEAIRDLELMVDRVTPYYKSIVDELPRYERQVFDTIALNWDPITRAQISEISGIKSTSIPPTCNRLFARGLIGEHKIGNAKAYELDDRFMNTWYLLRHASRRTGRARVRGLVKFMTDIYPRKKRLDLAKTWLQDKPRSRMPGEDTYGFVLAISVEQDDRFLARALRKNLADQIDMSISSENEGFFRLRPHDIDPYRVDREELKKRISISIPEDSASTFWEILMSAVTLMWSEKVAIVERIENGASWDSIQNSITVHERIVPGLLPIDILDRVKRLLLEGTIHDALDYVGSRALASYDIDRLIALVTVSPVSKKMQGQVNAEDRLEAIAFVEANHLQRSDEKQLLLARAYRDEGEFSKAERLLKTCPNSKLANLLLGKLYMENMDRFEDAESSLQEAIKIDPNYANAWDMLGALYSNHMNRIADAEVALLRAIEIDDRYLFAWGRLGSLYADKMERLEDAEAAFLKTLEVDGQYTWAWAHLGLLYAGKLGRLENAEAAFLKATEIDEHDTWSWVQLGILYRDQLGQPEDAKAALLKAIEIDDKYFWAWGQLGALYRGQMNRLEDAEAALLKAIEMDDKYFWAWGELGLLYRDQQNRPEDAEAAFLKAIEINEQYAWAWVQLGALYRIKMDRWEDAEAAFHKAIEIDEKLSWAWGQLGALYVDKSDRLEDAKAAFLKAIEIDEQYSWAWGELGYLYSTKMGQPEDAESAFLKAIEIDEQYDWALVQLGILYRDQLDRPEDAEAAFLNAIETDEQHSSAWAHVGILYRDELDRLEDAEAAFHKAIEINEQYAWAWVHLGILYRDQLDRPVDAEAAFLKAIEIDEQYPWAWGELGYLYSKKMSQPEDAKAAFLKAIEINEQYAWAWVHLGILYRDQHDRPEDAETAFLKAIEINEQNDWAWAHLGILYRDQLDRPEDAEAAFLKAIEINEQYAWAWAHLGILYRDQLNRPEDAEAAFLNAAKIDEQYAWPRVHLGILYRDHLDRPEDAEAAFLKAIEINEHYAWAWVTLGTLYRNKMDRPEDAESAFLKAIEIDEQYAWAWMHLGHQRALLNRPEEAEAHLQKAISIEPENSSLSIRAGNVMADIIKNTKAAHKIYSEAIAYVETSNDADKIHSREILLANIGWLHIGSGNFKKAKQIVKKLDGLPKSLCILLEAGCSLIQGKTTEAFNQLGLAFELNEPELWQYGEDDLLRFIRISHSLGKSAELLGWFDDSGHSVTQAPLAVALRAYNERSLIAIEKSNKETREPARRLLKWLRSGQY